VKERSCFKKREYYQCWNKSKTELKDLFGFSSENSFRMVVPKPETGELRDKNGVKE
jgi:hypothetical protein